LKREPSRGDRSPGASPIAASSNAAADYQRLELLAVQITPSGVFYLGGRPCLVIGNKRFEAGTRFTATCKDQDYELEVAAIEPPMFTLRYRGQQVTRPIKL
jgi:hypothetical protein